MKLNKTLLLLLFICLLIEIMLKQNLTFSGEITLLLDITFSFYVVNRVFFLAEEQYQKEKYLLNINNFLILLFIYFESAFSSSLILINIIFTFAIIFLVVNPYFPQKLNLKFFSILIIYFLTFFFVKDYLVMILVLKANFYLSIVYIYNIVLSMAINVLVVGFLTLLCRSSFKIKKKE